MRIIIYIIPIITLCSCSRVGSDPWVKLDYAKAECGSKEAILTTTGCITSPPNPNAVNNAANAIATEEPISSPDDVGSGHNSMNNKR